MHDAQFEASFYEEPFLIFGDHQKYIDPKQGLLAYGPCLHEFRRANTSTIKLGIIGSGDTIDLTKKWIEKCETYIPSKKEFSLLFQPFYGFTRIFGCRLMVIEECIELITSTEISEVLKSSNFDERVKVAANLIVNKLKNFLGRDPRPHVVICAIPQEILDNCEIRSRATPFNATSRNIESTIDKKVDSTDEDAEFSPKISNLRRIIKAESMMQVGIPTQLVKPRTLKVQPDVLLQDEATRAWNFSVAIYYKAEGYPWKMAEMENRTCYVGVSFFKEPNQRGNMRSSIAQVFTHTGEGLVVKGDRAIIDEETKSPHLNENGAYKILNDVLNGYNNQMRQYPLRVVIHKTSKFTPDEIKGFDRALINIPLKDYIAILDRDIRFLRKQGKKYPPMRGTVIKIAKKDFILFTKGYVNYFGTYPGLRVPRPIEIVEHYGESPSSKICQEIFALSKMNWNTADFCNQLPATLEYASEVGKILAYVPEEVIPRPEYRFYM